MARIAGASRALKRAQSGAGKDISFLLRDMAARVTNTIRSFEQPDGTLPRHRNAELFAELASNVRRMFVDESRTGIDDNGEPLSPMAAVILGYVEQVSRDIFASHERWLERNAPFDVLIWLQAGAPRETGVEESLDHEEEVVAEQAADYPDLLSTSDLDYDPAHLFVPEARRAGGPYRLSDRLWNTAEETRISIDRMVAQGIERGDGADRIARSVEQSLLRGARGRGSTTVFRKVGRVGGKRVRTPNVPYAAWRLGRTEITASAGRATIAASRANPYVNRLEWLLSPNHPRIDVCDGLQGIYAIGQEPLYPAHPNCLCVLVPVTTDSPSQVTADMRSLIEEGHTPGLNPASGQAFGDWALDPRRGPARRPAPRTRPSTARGAPTPGGLLRSRQQVVRRRKALARSSEIDRLLKRANSRLRRIKFTFNDGGRSAAGYGDTTGDCAVRAISIYRKDLRATLSGGRYKSVKLSAEQYKLRYFSAGLDAATENLNNLKRQAIREFRQSPNDPALKLSWREIVDDQANFVADLGKELSGYDPTDWTEGMPWPALDTWFSNEYNLKLVYNAKDKIANHGLLHEVYEQYGDGLYGTMEGRHVFAIVDGAIHDIFDSRGGIGRSSIFRGGENIVDETIIYRVYQ